MGSCVDLVKCSMSVDCCREWLTWYYCNCVTYFCNLFVFCNILQYDVWSDVVICSVMWFTPKVPFIFYVIFAVLKFVLLMFEHLPLVRSKCGTALSGTTRSKCYIVLLFVYFTWAWPIVVLFHCCLEVRGEIIRTVLCCIVYWNCAQS